MWRLCYLLLLIPNTFCDEVGLDEKVKSYIDIYVVCVVVEVCSRCLETWRQDANILLPQRSLQRQVLLF